MPTRPKTFNPYGRPRVSHPIRTPTDKESKTFLNSTAWKRLRLAILRGEPLCRRCRKEDRLVVAVIVHHIKERSERPDLSLDPENLEPLCSHHHSLHHTTNHAR